jgi:hypothetical protein
MDLAPPIVHLFIKQGKVWVGFSYPDCSSRLAGYEVRAGITLNGNGELIVSSYHSWKLSNPQRNYSWSCATEISTHSGAAAYGQVRVHVENELFSPWSSIGCIQMCGTIDSQHDALMSPKSLPDPPPIVEVFPRAGFVWVKYSYSNSPGIIGYAVRAGLELNDSAEIIGPPGPLQWTLYGPPEHNSTWSCSTQLRIDMLPEQALIYAQARVQLANGDWSSWSPLISSWFTNPNSNRFVDASASIIDASSEIAQAPSQCLVLDSDGCWQGYEPDSKSILIIAAGFNGNAERLHYLGYDTTIVYDKNYDSYPCRSEDFINRPICSNTDMLPKDLASMADYIVLPVIHKLISVGKGPAMIITGSRGGQVTICRLWRFWRGPSIVLNGGCVIGSAPPQGVTLGLLTQGRDFFETKSISYVQNKFSRWPSEVVHYHHEEDDHSVRSYNDIIGLVISMVLDIPRTKNAAVERLYHCSHGATMEGKLSIKPRGAGTDFIPIWN